jgi:hypothetical protein
MSTSRNLLRTLQDLITLGQKTEKFNRIFHGVRWIINQLDSSTMFPFSDSSNFI